MSTNLDAIVESIVEALSPVLTAALRPHVGRVSVAPGSTGVPNVVRLALRISALREELAATEAQLQLALREPLAEHEGGPEGENAEDEELSDRQDTPRAASMAGSRRGSRAPRPESSTNRPSTSRPSTSRPSTSRPSTSGPSASQQGRAGGRPPSSGSLKDRIVHVLEAHRGAAVNYRVLAKEVGAPEKIVHATLSPLVASGRVERPAPGQYRVSASTKSPKAGRPAPRATGQRPADASQGSEGATLYERVAHVVATMRGPFRCADIVEKTGGNPATVRTFLERLVARGAAQKAARGAYVAAGSKTKAPSSSAPASRGAKAAARPSQPLAERIVALLDKQGKATHAQEIAKTLQAELPTVSAALSKLVAAGKVRREKPGVFAPPHDPRQVPLFDEDPQSNAGTIHAPEELLAALEPQTSRPGRASVRSVEAAAEAEEPPRRGYVVRRQKASAEPAR